MTLQYNEFELKLPRISDRHHPTKLLLGAGNSPPAQKPEILKARDGYTVAWDQAPLWGKKAKNGVKHL